MIPKIMPKLEKPSIYGLSINEFNIHRSIWAIALLLLNDPFEGWKYSSLRKKSLL